MKKTFNEGKSLAQRLRQPGNRYEELPSDCMVGLDEDVIKQVEIEIKYAGYIKRERDRIQTAQRQESWRIPIDFDYDSIVGLRYEAQEKLKKIQPENLGQAGRISGVNPSDVGILSMALKKKETLEERSV